MLSIVFFLISAFVNCYYSFNIDTNYPIVYEDPSKYLLPSANISSYFGYSLVLYPGNRSNKPWVLIGAPKGTDTKKHGSGTCFKCGIAEPCEIFDVNAFSNSARSNYEEIIDHAWIGGSMDINYESERIVTCAPRWIKVQRSRDPKKDDYHMQGACYWFHTDDNSTQKLLPLLEPNKDVYTHPSGGGSVYYYAQGQSGFSVHMPVKEKEMLLGAPGVYNWDGTTILYKDNIESSPVASRLHNRGRSTRYADPSEFSYKNIANAIETKQTLAYDLLGYAATSGYFYSKKELLYVSSAPRSDYKGQILIYEFAKALENPLIVKETKHGQQFGEYFGGAVTAGDINNDGLDDLIVGAPFHTAQKYNEGKIYIFLGSKSGRLQEPKYQIVGKGSGGQFGTTVQYVGDINHDRFGDVAVAAPYEDDNSGVVYLFRGTADGLDTNFCQRIVGTAVYQSIRGFGMSISRAVDIDINRYPDLAIGAHLSGHVVVFRSRPVITVHQELISFAQHLEFKTRSFEIRECFSYQLDQMHPGNFSINRTLTLDQQLGRAYLENGEYVKIINLRPNQATCQNITVRLTKSFSNRYDPVTVSLSHTFITQEEHKQVLYVNQGQQGTDSFCPRCPVYNRYGSISSSTLKIPFALGCKSGNICRSSLEMTPKIIDIGEDNTFILGAKNYLTLQIDIKNSGEKAYLTQVLTTVPDSVTFRSTPSACTEKNSSSVMCSVDNPLDTESQKSVTLDLDMTTVNSGKYYDSLTFVIELFTSSENNGDKAKKLVIKLKREADVFITGKSEEQSYSYRNISEGKSYFTQIYQVEKFGRSPLNEILVEINVPYMFKAEDGREITFTGLYSPTGTLADQDISSSCTSDFAYIFEEKQSSSHIDFEEEEDTTVDKQHSKRFVRQVQVFNKSTTVRQRLSKENELESLQNRTYYLNCSMNEVVCSKVICTAGPLKSGQLAKIKLNMVLNIAALKDLLGKKDVILLATQGRVVVTSPKNFIQSGDKADSVDAVTLFIGESQKEDIALWIIIASAVAGLLLLSLLVVVLVKAGFFKRTTKEELEQLKKEMEYSAGTNLTEKEPEDE